MTRVLLGPEQGTKEARRRRGRDENQRCGRRFPTDGDKERQVSCRRRGSWECDIDRERARLPQATALHMHCCCWLQATVGNLALKCCTTGCKCLEPNRLRHPCLRRARPPAGSRCFSKKNAAALARVNSRRGAADIVSGSWQAAAVPKATGRASDRLGCTPTCRAAPCDLLPRLLLHALEMRGADTWPKSLGRGGWCPVGWEGWCFRPFFARRASVLAPWPRVNGEACSIRSVSEL